MPPPYERHLFVCTNRRPEGSPRPSCAARGSETLHAAFKQELAGRGLADRIRANKARCLDACELGMSVVVYPDEVWYAHVTLDDVREIVEEHIVGGRPVERLRMKFDELPAKKKLPPVL